MTLRVGLPGAICRFLCGCGKVYAPPARRTPLGFILVALGSEQQDLEQPGLEQQSLERK
jgi:hypothetical protein